MRLAYTLPLAVAFLRDILAAPTEEHLSFEQSMKYVSARLRAMFHDAQLTCIRSATPSTGGDEEAAPMLSSKYVTISFEETPEPGRSYRTTSL